MSDAQRYCSRDIAYIAHIRLSEASCVICSRSYSEIWRDISPPEMDHECEKKGKNECIFGEFLDFRGYSHMLEAVKIDRQGSVSKWIYSISFSDLMQKIRSFLSYFVITVFFFGIFAPIGASFAWQEKYDYTQYSDNINISSSNNTISQDLHFDTPRTSFSLVFSGVSLPPYSDIRVDWIVDGKVFSRHLDLDDRPDI